ncbi:MAG: helix-turn-helix domain-containing protein [Ruminococcaceae bacterium]|nr:helix-turn-helix domain-containing protein [Oscillospiraceae bacterium]
MESMLFNPWKNEDTAIQIRYSSIDAENRTARFPLHWHAYFELEFYLEGDADNVINGKVHKMHAGSLALLSPNDFHKISHESGNLRIRKLTFLPSALSAEAMQALEEYGYPFILNLDELEAEKLYEKFRQLAEACTKANSDTAVGMLRIRCRAEEILLSIFECAAPHQCLLSHPKSSPVLTVIRYINDHLDEMLSVSRLAALVYLSPDHLTHIFKNCTSVSITEYIIEQRMSRAYYMLMDTDMPPADIASAVGYRSIALFYRHFRRRFDAAPGDLRRELK